jgi:hypothetical protein
MVVRLLGNAWRSPSVEGCHFSDEGQYVFSLTRVDAFRVFAPGFVEESSHSDLGSSGGKIGYYSLGKDMEATANRLGRFVERAYRENGRDPARLTISAVNELVNMLQMSLLRNCGGLPGGDPPSRCGQAATEVEAKWLVKSWIDGRGPTAP